MTSTRRCDTADPNESSEAAAWRRVLETLATAGVDAGALEAAAKEGNEAIARLAARHLLFPGARTYTPRDVYALSGIEEETAQSLWRAMGFPLVPEDVQAFTDADVEALTVAVRLFGRVGMDKTVVLQQARTMGQAAARIAQSHQDVIDQVAMSDGDAITGALEAVTLAEDALPALDHLLVYMYRRHLAAATEQRMLISPGEAGGITMSIGFADLVGFTALSRDMRVHEIADLVDRFNATASNAVTQGGGRVIKTIGDEVMFAALDPAGAAAIATALISDVSGVSGVPPLRIGVATGVVIAREGDVFGPPVNLASRLVAKALPHSVLVDEATAEAIDHEHFRLSPLSKQFLKGIGSVQAFRLRPTNGRSDPMAPARHARKTHRHP